MEPNIWMLIVGVAGVLFGLALQLPGSTGSEKATRVIVERLLQIAAIAVGSLGFVLVGDAHGFDLLWQAWIAGLFTFALGTGVGVALGKAIFP